MTTAADTSRLEASTRSTPEQRILTASLLLAPAVYLAADTTYAAQGWDSAGGGVVHVVGAVAYALAFLGVAAWLPPASRLRAVLVVVGTIGSAGNVAYGFESIRASLGDVPLVDQSGAAGLIKPIGLFFPLALLLVAVALRRLGHGWQSAVILLAALAWPVAHVADLAVLAVTTDVALLLALGSVATSRFRRR